MSPVLFNCGTPSQIPASKTLADTGYTYRSGSPDGIGKFYFGREIAHVMGASGAAWLERDERQAEENTLMAIDSMKLLPNTNVADIGAGTGYYTFKMAERVPAGLVYAVEIQDEMIRYLSETSSKRKSNNVKIVKGSTTVTNLPANSLDLAIMVDVYHELEFPAEVLQSISNALTSNGKLLLIEYRGEDRSIPIKALHKTSVAQLDKELGANGFQLAYKGDFLPIQHFLVYQKRSRN
ncbi:class I SAM-dependent methyltransferase [Segetibacter sp. 3557_3]|uniref:class I SAM-dependent methyltransferase n=1 Tax=Segetibacter sp. 3557_3 TaxID=2547429 RepID=UPI001A9E451E|nr:methyltransferase domain-containing protein [Segetibacter sp. 3557_3]